MDVLIVDNENISRRNVSNILHAAGYRVTAVNGGQEAWDALQEQRHQLVVSEWDMPDMSGIELCRAIRAGEFRRYVYFIMLTNHKCPDDVVEGLSAGADDYVTKPFNPKELVLRVEAGRRIVGLETHGMTVLALAKLAESRDSETGAHLERVQRYCEVLARHLQMTPRFQGVIDDEFVRLIYESSPLHDIGKVSIPDNVLLKPGRLTSDEFDTMKTHTLQGAKTLDQAIQEFPEARFLQMARSIALSHHERYDGTGYPQGLAGDAIPLCSRILALADVYDALTSQRVYKEALSHEESKAIILAESGKQFDPDIVAAFCAEEQIFIEIRARFAPEGANTAKATFPPGSPPDDESDSTANYTLASASMAPV